MKQIKGYEGYFIDENGVVWSDKLRFKGDDKKLRIRKNIKNLYGYMQISLSNNGITGQFKIHRLVAETFIPNIDNKPFVNHINGDKTDNRVENLEWCTGSENMRHAYKNGLLSAVGERNGQCKLTEEQVLLIREDERKHQKIAQEYNVSRELISSIKKRQCWKHI